MGVTQMVIQEALNQEDIEGLLDAGAPDDEYVDEAKAIMSQLGQDGISEEDLAAVVREVWTRAFGPFTTEEVEMRSPAFRQVAHRILSS